MLILFHYCSKQVPNSEVNFAEKVTIFQEERLDFVTSVLLLYNITKAGDRGIKCVARNMAGTAEEMLLLVIDGRSVNRFVICVV